MTALARTTSAPPRFTAPADGAAAVDTIRGRTAPGAQIRRHGWRAGGTAGPCVSRRMRALLRLIG